MKYLQLYYTHIGNISSEVLDILWSCNPWLDDNLLFKSRGFMFKSSANRPTVCAHFRCATGPPRSERNVSVLCYHNDDVIKWKHIPRYWPFVWIIHRSPMNSQHKDQWRGALMFSLICPLNKWLSKQSWCWWFETQSRSLWRHCSDNYLS